MTHRRYCLLSLAILCFTSKSDGAGPANTLGNSCKISINKDLAEPQPLVLRPNSTRLDFVYPSRQDIIEVPKGKSIRLACPGSTLNINTTNKSYEETLVTCKSGNLFLLESPKIKAVFNNISCKRYPEYVAKRTGQTCGDGVDVEIGFELKTEFSRVIDLCHNEKLGHTIYAHAKILASIGGSQKSFPRKEFAKGPFYRGIKVSEAYSKESQRATMEKILGSKALVKKYFPAEGQYFFARGHLIAKTDLVYGSQQRATFLYVNVVPMWQVINSGNWEKMEGSVKKYASWKRRNLDVWAGGIGTLTLPDTNGNEQEIYLQVAKKQGKAIPVPKIIFKVVYNGQSRSGIVFLTANNPHLDNLTNEYRVCNDVCNQINYVTWNRTNAKLGLSYCCDIDDFRKVFRYLPRFQTDKLLL